MTQSDDTNRFLRSAIKTGLRLQQRQSVEGSADSALARSEGVSVLQRIKSSLRKRNSRRQHP